MIAYSRKIANSFFTLTETAPLFLGLVLAITPVGAEEDSQNRRTQRNLTEIGHIIVIYQENWSFDSLYGQFPGANGYANSFDTLPQLDVKADPPYSSLIYQTPSPLDESFTIDPQFPAVGGKPCARVKS